MFSIFCSLLIVISPYPGWALDFIVKSFMQFASKDALALFLWQIVVCCIVLSFAARFILARVCPTSCVVLAVAIFFDITLAFFTVSATGLTMGISYYLEFAEQLIGYTCVTAICLYAGLRTEHSSAGHSE
jgi:hypothetical protein